MIWLPLYALASIYVLWIFYLAVMNLMRARDAGTLTRTANILGRPILYIGLLIDLLVNVFVLTIILMEIPRRGEWLVTARLKRHFNGEGWRKSVAAWFSVNLLDAFDPSGRHLR